MVIPTRLGRYEVIKHLANGGMAQVLIARATGIAGFERHVVIKRIHAEHASNPAFVEMFLDEARLAAHLHHNNIVQVHDIGQEKGEYFFAMEYLHGRDLRRVLVEVSKRNERVPWEHVVTIMTNAAAGLHHAHEQHGPDRKPLGLIHRDVSPANIIVGYDGTVKVVDFGIAKAALRTSEGTKDGALKGKVAYMAPEQCTGKLMDRRTDVYALGIVLYELCTVRRLFKCDSDFMTMSAIVEGDIPHPSKPHRVVPPALVDIIMKALALAPADRYQTAEDLRVALEEFADAQKLRTSTGALASYMKRLFGVQPEPWLVDNLDLDQPPDFDLSMSDIRSVRASDQSVGLPLMLDLAASAPIMRAHKKLADSQLVALTAVLPDAGLARPFVVDPPAPVSTLPPVALADPGWSVTPTVSNPSLAWAATAPSAPRTYGWVIASVAVFVFVVVGVGIATRGGNGKPAVPRAAPQPIRADAVVVDPAVAAVPIPVQPVSEVIEPSTGSGSAAAGSANVKPVEPPRGQKKKKWNPDQLFID